MATFRLRRFCGPQTLKAISPARLVAFLAPYRDYLAGRGIALPPPEKAEQLDLGPLVAALASPEAGMPRELIDALFLIDEMSTPSAMDALLGIAGEQLKLDAAGKPTPADVAVAAWLLVPEILQRKHAEQFLFRPRSFQYYQAGNAVPDALAISVAKAQEAMQREMDDWFEKKNRGRGSQVFFFPNEDEIWILLRHGEPFRREETLEDAGSLSSVCYRPIKYDVVVYRQDRQELGINARSDGERQFYRRLVGKHLFGDPEFFPGGSKYTFAPLRDYGADCLSCFDVEGIEWVRLTEVQWLWAGEHSEIEIRKADDLFAAMEARGQTIPEHCRILQAKFRIKFTDAKAPRSVKIRGSNVTEYTRDSDAGLVEQWFASRGFIVLEESDADEALEEVLVGD